MAQTDVSGTISTVNFCFKVSNISKLDSITSPDFIVQGIPWNVKVCKNVNGKNESLDIFLRCARDKYEEDWLHAAFAKVKLMPFNKDTNPVERRCDPYVFDDDGDCIGTSSFISWQDLFDSKKNYVQNDTIQLDINIEADGSDKNTTSKMTFEKVETCCEEDCFTTYRISVTNIEDLMAVRSPIFNLRKMPWALTIFKSCSSSLNIRFESKSSVENFSCKTQIWLRLISSKGDEMSIEKTDNCCIL